MTERFIKGFVVHLFCDWFLQNDWMAKTKADLSQPAGYIHAGIHSLGLLMVFKPATAAILGLLHLLIDTRRPLVWWREFYRQTTEGEAAIHVAFWEDQVAHIVLIFLASLWEGRADG